MMMETLLTVDPYKKNAYSNKVSFDISARSLNETPSSAIVPSHEEYNPEVSMKKTPSKDWELDVRALISTKKWLQNYGLQRNKLSLFQLLPAIGFRMSDDFDRVIKRPVASRYAEGLFNQLQRADGKMFNVTCGRDKLRQIEHRLQQAIHLYKRRLDWLTTESRRLFGVIEERAVTIVLDIRNMSPQQFDLYKMALERVIYEQVTQIAKFNLIRASDTIKMYQDDCVPVTHDTIEGAIKWLWDLDRLAGVSKTACVEAVLRACEDKQNEAVYLFTEGSSVETCRELLMQKVCALETKPPINVVSYNCDSSDTVRFLREFAKNVAGKFHVYAVIMEMDSYEGQPVDPHTNKANIILKRKTFGGIPPGAGMRDDVIELFQELEEARTTLGQIQKLVGIMPEPNIVLESELAPVMDIEKMNEQYMSSRQWLEKYGLAARKLELFDVLSGVAFKHKDGVVGLKTHPGNDFQTDAINVQKLVNAKYCDRFPVVKWRDGRVVHVQVTPELHRNYEQKMMTALRCIQQRIDWLSQGSRALFGTVIEEQIYILIDTSESMVPSIQYVKDKLFLLMQEQLRHKMKFNLIAFNSKAQVWQNRLVEVSETSLEGAWRWIQGLTCWGSTNTYAALQHALGDPGTQAIYLLTDGRPDQPPKSIVAQVQMQHSVPVHTISFNCNDSEANRFLSDLARATGGRYHYFSEKGMDLEDQPESWESEDIRLLKDTLRKGLEDLDKVAELRDECSKLSWKKEIDNLKKCSKNHPLPETDRVSAVPPMEPQVLYRSESPLLPRPSSAPPDRKHSPAPPPKTATSVELRSLSTVSSRHKFARPSSARPGSARPTAEKPIQRPLAAGHTRTSLLRTLNSSGSFNAEEWLLPETRQLFERQAARQKKLALGYAALTDTETVEARMERAKKAERRRYSKQRNLSSKQWLWKHGLIAKKLTLLDALAPTFIPHKSKYVPILDKHVLSKVFDEVLPIAHVSNKSRKPLKLINPNAANLDDYELKLQKALDLYNRRLDSLVWEAIPKEVRDEEFGEDAAPCSFIKNRSWCIKALEESHWPINEQDILLLEEEIAKGERFLQQSKDLRKAANPGVDGDDDELTVYDDKASNISGLSARSKELSQSKDSLSSTKSKESSSSSSHSKDSKHSKTSTQNTEVHVRKRPKYVRKPPEGGGPSTGRSEDTDVSTRLGPLSDREKEDMGGPRVLACYRADGLYYPAHVQKPSNAMYAIVMFNFKKRQKVRTQFLIPIGGAVPRPELAEGDFVLVRVYNQMKNLECYVPAIVEFLPEDQRHPHKFYSVLMFNGQRASTMRRYLVKIGRDRFTKAVEYISQIQQLSDNNELPVWSLAPPDERSRDERSERSGSALSESATPKSSVREIEVPTAGTERTDTERSSKKSTERASRSGSSSASGSESRSGSKSSSRSRSRSSSRSRSRSRSKASRSRSGSRSGSSSSRSRSRSQKKARPRSTSKSRSRSRSRSRSGSRSRSRTPKNNRKPRFSSELNHRSPSSSPPRSPIERPSNPVPRPVHSRLDDIQGLPSDEKDQMITELQYQLEKQTRRQLRQERRLVRQARKINKIQRKLKDTDLNESVQSEKSGHSDIVHDRSKGSPDGTSNREAFDILSDSKQLPSVDGNREVLARWSDDGWYYHGLVIKETKDKCIIQDATGYHEAISKDDIIIEANHSFDVIQPHDCVIGLHPNYIYSYAPGEVHKVSYSSAATVEFYDGVVADLPKREVFKISRSKFNSDKAYIMDQERKILWKSVIARDDDTGYYRLGVVDYKENEGQKYRIKWLDGTVSTQSAHHTFLVQQNRTHYTSWNYVLAPTEQLGGNILYKPAKVVLTKPLQVLFSDGRSSVDLKLNECFWISEEYYQNASRFIQSRNQGF